MELQRIPGHDAVGEQGQGRRPSVDGPDAVAREATMAAEEELSGQLVARLHQVQGVAHLPAHRLIVEEAQQINRTAARDNSSPEQVKAILAAQMSREERLKQADSILDNRGDLAQLEQQVDALHQQLLKAASSEIESN